jgi:hypothetical protein
MQGDPTTCGYIHPEIPVVKFEAQEQQLKATKEASCDCCSELKLEFEELKQTLDIVVSELCRPEVKHAEPIHEPLWLSVCGSELMYVVVSHCVCELGLAY